MELVDRREILGRHRAFSLAQAGETVADRRDEAAVRVVVGDVRSRRGFHRHCTLMPASRITFAQRIASVAMCRAHSSGVLPTG